MIGYPKPRPLWYRVWKWFVALWERFKRCIRRIDPDFIPEKRPCVLPGEFWCVTAYFNPIGYRSKITNFKIFCDRLRAQGAKLFAVECALPHQDFVLQEFLPPENLIQVRSRHIIWQKERLLNMAVERLPEACDKVAWLDCDVYFRDKRWIARATKMLEDYKIIQLYSRRYLLDRDGSIYKKEGRYLRGWLAQIEHTGKYDGGHPGYAWAARRDFILKHPLYERCITGVGDFLFACAVCNLHKHLIGKDFHEWADQIVPAVENSVSYLPGSIYHLYHGPYEKRNYLEAVMKIGESTFDPKIDLRVNRDGCLEWATEKEIIHQACKGQLKDREEDN